MKILITGAGGQLGQALRSGLDRHEIIPFSHDELDITGLDKVRRAIETHEPQILINAAAYTNVDAAESDRESAFRINALGPRNLAIATAEADIPIVHVSTDYVFNGMSERPYHEFDEPDPQTVYGRSKLAGEREVAAYNPRHYIIRTAWLYHTGGRNFPKTMLDLAGREEVRVVSDQYGSPTYARHLVRAIDSLIGTGAFGVRHLAGGNGTSWYELTRLLYDLMGVRTQVRPVATADFPRPAQRPRYSVLASMADPQIVLPPWQEGLKEFVNDL